MNFPKATVVHPDGYSVWSFSGLAHYHVAKMLMTAEIETEETHIPIIAPLKQKYKIPYLKPYIFCKCDPMLVLKNVGNKW